MVTLRLARHGSKKRPTYHLVAADSRKARDGRYIEQLGYFIPHRDIVVLQHDRIDYWLSVGAKASPTAKNLINQSKKSAGAAVGA